LPPSGLESLVLFTHISYAVLLSPSNPLALLYEAPGTSIPTSHGNASQEQQVQDDAQGPSLAHGGATPASNAQQQVPDSSDKNN
jgi:hypothetical protein